MRLLVVFALLPLLVACRKDPPEEPIIRLIPEEMRAYWDFKPGTYWIYKDSVSGAIDSVYVTYRTNYTAQGILNYNQKPMTYEYLQFNTHSSLDGHNYSYWINTQAGLKGFEQFNRVFGNKSGVETHSTSVYPHVVGNYITKGYGSATDVDTCVIKNIYISFYGYKDVVRVDNTFNSFENHEYTKSYYAKHIGLIRYEVPDSNKYRIHVNYHIEP